MELPLRPEIPTLHYANSKGSGIEWLDDIPDHWNVLPLFALAKLKSVTGCMERELLSVYLDKGVIRFSDVDEKRTNVTSLDLSKYQAVDPGDLVLNNQQAWRGSVGVSNLTGIVSPAYIVLKLDSRLTSKFANYLFRDPIMISNYLVCSKGVGTIQRNIYWPQLRRVKVFIPPINEQTLIARFLDRKTALIDKALAQKEKLIELLKERRQILIHNAVTKGLNPNVKMKDSGVEWIGEIPEHWERIKAGKLARIIRGASPRPSGDPKYFGGSDVNWITVGDITKDNKIYLESTLECLTSAGRKHSRFLEIGTFVLTNSGATLGVPKILKIAGCINDGVLAFLDVNEHRITKIFLYYYFKSITEWLRDKMNQGATQPNLNTDVIKQVSVPIAPLHEQRTIVLYIEQSCKKIDTVISKANTAIGALAEYRSTLINSAVTGKIKVPDLETVD